MYDVVYPYRFKGSDTELRYSLRSISKYLIHRNVYIVGDKPDWLVNVHHIKSREQKDGQMSVIKKLKIIAETESVSKKFILMNDDFFITRQIRDVKYFYTDDFLDFHARQIIKGMSNFVKSGYRTMVLLPANAKNYSLHIPFIYEKKKILELFKKFPLDKSIHFRTLYGNYFQVGGSQRKDVKASSMRQVNKFSYRSFLSCTDLLIENSKFKEWLKKKYPYRCRYEL